MLLACDDDEDMGEHPYWHTLVLSVFHVHACLALPFPYNMPNGQEG